MNNSIVFPDKWLKDEENQNDESKDFTVIIITSSIVGIVLVIILIIIVYWFCCRTKVTLRKSTNADTIDATQPATRLSLIGKQYQPEIDKLIGNQSQQKFLSTNPDPDYDNDGNRKSSIYLFQDESLSSRKSSKSSHIFSMNDVESQMITASLTAVAPLASCETLESSAPMSRPMSTYERNDIKPVAIVKPRPQSEVFEEDLVKPSLPPKKASIKTSHIFATIGIT